MTTTASLRPKPRLISSVLDYNTWVSCSVSRHTRTCWHQLFIPQSSTLSKGKCFILPSGSKGYHLFCVACTGHYLVSFLFAEYFKSLLNAVFSSSNPQRKAKEEQTFIYFMDFIEECEGMYVTLISMYVVQYYFLFWKPRWYCSN